MGELAISWLNNEPILLETPGCYAYDTADFVFVRHQPLSDKVIELGSKKIVTVIKGEICVTHQHGALRLLMPGRHVLEDAAHTIDGFLPTEACSPDAIRDLEMQNAGLAHMLPKQNDAISQLLQGNGIASATLPWTCCSPAPSETRIRLVT